MIIDESRAPPRVLVVDDVASNVSLIAQALEPVGYEIYVARNGEEALRIASRAEPHVILLDVMMPGVDGLTVCRHMKADAALAAIPVIFITALDDRDALRRGFEAGAVDYVVKPFFAEEVVLRVGTQVRLSQLNLELAARNTQLEQANQRLAEEHEDTNRQTVPAGDNPPGNVNELRKLLERALLMTSGLPEDEQLNAESQSSESYDTSMPLNLKEAEQILVRRALDVAGGNMSEAARLLGVHRTRLYRMLDRQSDGDDAEGDRD